MKTPMSLLRDQSPRPMPRPRKPAYPRALEVGMLLLLGACSKSNDAARDIPPPPPAGVMVAPMADAEAPVQPAPMGTAPPVMVDAGVPEAGQGEAGTKDAGTRQRAVQPPLPSPPGGIQAPYVEPTPPKPVGSR